MTSVIPASREELSAYAPRVVIIEIHPDQIGNVIGPGGKVIKKIQNDLGVKIDIEQTGRVFIAAPDLEIAMAARQIIEGITRDITEGEVYVGKVIEIKPIGAIVEFAPGRDGMIHISQLAHERVGQVTDVVNIGDEVVVKVIERDPTGKVRLSRKAMLPAPEPGEPGYMAPGERRDRDDRGPRRDDRGPRRDDRGGRGVGGDRGPRRDDRGPRRDDRGPRPEQPAGEPVPERPAPVVERPAPVEPPAPPVVERPEPGNERVPEAGNERRDSNPSRPRRRF
jgi:polyribonucleotide nucleotidyltransferase